MGFRFDLILPPPVHMDFVFQAGVSQTVTWAEERGAVSTSHLLVFKKNKMKVGLPHEFE